MLDDDFLTLWRRLDRQRAGAIARADLQARLVSVTPPHTLPGAGAIPLAVGARLAAEEAPHDLVMTWVLLAALGGDPLAALELALVLWSQRDLQADAAKGAQEVVPKGRDLAQGWMETAARRLDCRVLSSAGAASLGTRLAQLAERIALPAAAMAERGVPLAATPVLRPVAAIPAVTGSGREIEKAYGKLTQPLPLAGGRLSPDLLGRVLREEFPWMEAVIDALVADLRLMRAAGRPWLHLQPTLVVGPPGGGKTRLARRIATLAGTGFGEIGAAGSADNRLLAGTARGWGTAQPALPLVVMQRTGVANPVIVVDEIEKAGGSSRNGDMRATLLGMLEPETAAAWPDECLCAPADLSQVSWILTANTLEGLSSPLLSRLRVVPAGRPEPGHFDAVLAGLLRDAGQMLGMPPAHLPELEAEVVAALRDAFARGASIRRVKNALLRALAHARPGGGMLH